MSQKSRQMSVPEVTFDQNELLDQAGVGLDDLELPQDEISPITEALDDLGNILL